MNELKYMGSKEVPNSLYGEPLSHMMYIWPVQIDVEKDAANKANFKNAVSQQINVVQSLCQCQAPPERNGDEIDYPLAMPISTTAAYPITQWEKVIKKCQAGTLDPPN